MEITIRHQNKFGDKLGARHLVDDGLIGLARDPAKMVTAELAPLIQSVIDLANSDERPDPEPDNGGLYTGSNGYIIVLDSNGEIETKAYYASSHAEAIEQRENLVGETALDWRVYARAD